MHPILSAALFSLLPLSFAANIPIAVGNGGLIFNPSIVTANVGDTLSFSYYPRNHSVAQSSFADPCHPLASSGIFSGFQPLSAGPGPVEFVVEVNDTKPIWIYCSQAKGSHCQNGMAMVVNQPIAPSLNTLDAYKAAATKSGNSTSPSHVAGGMFVSRNSTSTTGRNSTASSTGSSNIASSSSASGIGSGSGSITTTGGSPQSSFVSFKGAASKTVTGVSAVCGAAALILFALV